MNNWHAHKMQKCVLILRQTNLFRIMDPIRISLMTYIHVIISFPVFSTASGHSKLKFVTSQIYQPSTVNVKDIKSQSKIHCLAICMVEESCSYAIHKTTTQQCRMVENAECKKWKEEEGIENVNAMIKGNACDQGWMYCNGHCYILSTDEKQFVDAEADCNTFGAHLVSIYCNAISLWLKEAYSGIKDIFLIGANCRQRNGDWRWITDNKPVTYTNWHQGEPNDGGSQCVIACLRRDHWAWDDIGCGFSWRYVCEK